MWQPKSVDDLRVMTIKAIIQIGRPYGTCYAKVQNRGIQMVKRRPEGFFVNDKNLGMVAGVTSAKQST